MVRTALFFAFLLPTGCGGKPFPIPPFEPSCFELLGPGDVISIKFFKDPDLNATQTIRPDGTITLQLIGDVNVSGKTRTEVENLLVKQYSSQLSDPIITVIPDSFYSHRVYIGGEVNQPMWSKGHVEMKMRMTVFEAVIQTGGFNFSTADTRNVFVIRYKGSKRQIYRLNLSHEMAGKETNPFYLEPYDYIYVPRTRVAQINQWMNQHIDRILPGAIMTILPWLLYDQIMNK